MSDRETRRRRPAAPAGDARHARGRSGVFPAALLLGLVGAFASAGMVLAHGGGVLLALLAYSLGGTMALFGAAAFATIRTPIRTRARAFASRSFRVGADFGRSVRLG